MHTSAATERDPSTATPVPIAPDHFATVVLDAIQPSAVNPRKYFDPVYLEQLAASIRSHGILEPLVLRQLDTDGGSRRFEIIAGECRFRAARAAGLQNVPAMVKQLTDEEALEVRLIENIHRRGLTPLEEAVGYRALIDSNPTKHSAESIATRLGLSPKYVWDRMKLIDLVPTAKALLDQERINAGHAILIARQKPADQQRIVDVDSAFWKPEYGLEFEADTPKKKASPWDGLKPMSVRELERWIAEHIRFDVTAQVMAAPLEFGETHEAVQQRLAQPGRGKKVIRITYDHFVKPDARDEADRTYGPQSWKRADGKQQSKTCEHSVLGVVAVGEGYGSAFDVCIAKDKCDVHWKAERLKREKTAKQRPSPSKQREKFEQQRKQHEEEELAKAEAQRTTWQKAAPALLEACAAKIKQAKPATLGPFMLAHLEVWGDAQKRAAQLLPTPRQAEDYLRHAALSVLAAQLSNSYLAPKEFPSLVKPFGVDLKAVFDAQRPAAGAKRKAGKKR